MGVRRRQQEEARKAAVKFAVKKILPHLRADKQRIFSTNRLLPVGSLRRGCIKKIFGGCPSEYIGAGRVFTLKLAQQICRRLRQKLGMDRTEFFQQEAVRLHELLKSSRKRQVQTPMSAADSMETQPLEQVQDRFIRRFQFSMCVFRGHFQLHPSLDSTRHVAKCRMPSGMEHMKISRSSDLIISELHVIVSPRSADSEKANKKADTL